MTANRETFDALVEFDGSESSGYKEKTVTGTGTGKNDYLAPKISDMDSKTNAFLIMVQKRRPQIEIATSIGRIASIDAANGFLYTGNPNDINSQVRYVVSNSTFSDPSGRPITLSSLRPSQRVRITHATTQTASIPPQTIAFHVQLL